ncbi:hypothetical protein BJ741DRAFT_648351 [Chytriomyces cf. hyalinus JEL632]|nr:hypothetical protein BJ741DRAFT_648351 [Chytriomyces cf. hyalinus JEL632]
MSLRLVVAFVVAVSLTFIALEALFVGRKTPPARQPHSSNAPRITYLNTHHGTNNNFKEITKRLGLTFHQFNPFRLGYGMDGTLSQELISAGWAKSLCESTDIIVTSDTAAHSRFILETFLNPDKSKHCSAKVVVELTTRYDWDVKDLEEYRRLFWHLGTHNNVHWVTNNPMEPRYLADFSLVTPKFRMMRPVGYSSVPANDVSSEEAKLPMLRLSPDNKILKILTDLKVPYHHAVQQYGSTYGGPKTAAKHKAFIEFPYQVSTMKMYENIMAGVVIFIPSPEFYLMLHKNDTIASRVFGEILMTGNEWTKYNDYYCDDMKPFLYTFDSFPHLKQLLEQTPTDSRNLRKDGPVAYKKFIEAAVLGWADLFDELGFPMTVDGKPHVVGSGPTPYSEEMRGGIRVPKTESEWKSSYDAMNKLLDDAKKKQLDSIIVDGRVEGKSS